MQGRDKFYGSDESILLVHNWYVAHVHEYRKLLPGYANHAAERVSTQKQEWARSVGEPL